MACESVIRELLLLVFCQFTILALRTCGAREEGEREREKGDFLVLVGRGCLLNEA